MKKRKRILAIVGVFLLCALYISTLIFALIDSPKTMGMFKASVAGTILVPVLLYGYIMFYRLSHKDQDENE